MNEVNLRPLSIGELLDKAFQIYRARFFSFLGISALFTLPVALADTITILTQTSSFYTRLFIGPFFTSIAIVFMTRLMSQLYLKQPSSIHQDSFRSYRNVFSIFGVTFLMALIGIYFYTRFSQSLIVGGFTTISMSYWIANYLAILAYFILDLLQKSI